MIEAAQVLPIDGGFRETRAGILTGGDARSDGCGFLGSRTPLTACGDKFPGNDTRGFFGRLWGVRLLAAGVCSLLLGVSDPTTKAQTARPAWVSDNGDGTYTNPVLYADYSDPDVIRVGSDYYMTSSSFQCAPGLPILHSRDLVNWTIIGHALQDVPPSAWYRVPRHGCGVWAPALRYHSGEFRIYYGDPDFGIYLCKAKNAAGPWEPPVLVQATRGWIDPSPFWDEDGNAYLVHAWAKSRVGFNGILTMRRMNQDGTAVVGDSVNVFDGGDRHPTIEGPKLYKRGEYYYVFAPAGGVKNGWQTVLRSRSISGPYEDRIVMEQGKTTVNGPHQGAWVELASGESWFVHFQDRDAYGRVVYLQPLAWSNGWPVLGADPDGDGRGEPVLTYRKPSVVSDDGVIVPQTSDEFNTGLLGVQWQWHANPRPNWIGFSGESIRLKAVASEGRQDQLWDAPNLLLQKFPAPAFTATAAVRIDSLREGDRGGLLVMGADYACLALSRDGKSVVLRAAFCVKASGGAKETIQEERPVNGGTIVLRVSVDTGAVCRFAFSTDGETFTEMGEQFQAVAGKWIGAKVGLFCGSSGLTDGGYLEVDWLRVRPSER